MKWRYPKQEWTQSGLLSRNGSSLRLEAFVTRLLGELRLVLLSPPVTAKRSCSPLNKTSRQPASPHLPKSNRNSTLFVINSRWLLTSLATSCSDGRLWQNRFVSPRPTWHRQRVADMQTLSLKRPLQNWTQLRLNYQRCEKWSLRQGYVSSSSTSHRWHNAGITEQIRTRPSDISWCRQR